MQNAHAQKIADSAVGGAHRYVARQHCKEDGESEIQAVALKAEVRWKDVLLRDVLLDAVPQLQPAVVKPIGQWSPQHGVALV